MHSHYLYHRLPGVAIQIQPHAVDFLDVRTFLILLSATIAITGRSALLLHVFDETKSTESTLLMAVYLPFNR